MKKNIFIVVLLSFILGSIYYYIMESSIPKDSNCSFIASPLTDILAFIVGFIVIYKANKYNDNILAILGGAMVIEHIWQLFPKFTMNKFI